MAVLPTATSPSKTILCLTVGFLAADGSMINRFPIEGFWGFGVLGFWVFDGWHICGAAVFDRPCDR